MHHSPHHKFMQSVLWSLKTRQHWSVNINGYKLVLWNLIFSLHLYSAQRLWLWLIKTNVKKIKFSHLHWLSGWNYPPSCVWFTWVGVLCQVIPRVVKLATLSSKSSCDLVALGAQFAQLCAPSMAFLFYAPLCPSSVSHSLLHGIPVWCPLYHIPVPWPSTPLHAPPWYSCSLSSSMAFLPCTSLL